MTEPEGNSVVGVEPGSGSVVLTYDDGPTPGVTDRLLTVLADAGASATFFVLLTRARRQPGSAPRPAGGGPRDRAARPRPPTAHHRRPRHPARDRCATRDASWRTSRPCRSPGSGRPTARRTRRLACRPGGGPDAGAVEPATVRLAGRAARRAADRAPRAAPWPAAVVLLHDGFADAADGVDDGPPPAFDRCASPRRSSTRSRPQGSPPGASGAALETSTAVWRPWFDEG